MAVRKSAQILMEATGVLVAMVIACQIMVCNVMVSDEICKVLTSSVSNYVLLSDIDECTENRDNCGQLCSNIIGSYSCNCRSGYRLASDGVTCNGTQVPGPFLICQSVSFTYRYK